MPIAYEGIKASYFPTALGFFIWSSFIHETPFRTWKNLQI